MPGEHAHAKKTGACSPALGGSAPAAGGTFPGGTSREQNGVVFFCRRTCPRGGKVFCRRRLEPGWLEPGWLGLFLSPARSFFAGGKARLPGGTFPGKKRPLLPCIFVGCRSVPGRGSEVLQKLLPARAAFPSQDQLVPGAAHIRD